MSAATVRDRLTASDEEREIDQIAARDRDEPMPDATDPNSMAAPRWCRPLADTLGTEEPSDDDGEDWIIRDVFPRGEAAIWAGPPKAGKTWAALDLAVCVARGESWLGGTFENTLGEPARVLVVALEDGPRRLRSRLWELCRNYGTTPNEPTIAAHLMISREALRLPGDERVFRAELQHARPVLVLADCLTRIMVGDQNSIRDVAAFTAVWSRMCSDVGASIAFLHHTGKVGDKTRPRDPFELIRGSSDLLATARNAVVSMPLALDGDAVSEVRFRGNLDLRRERFALGFARTLGADGRYTARMVDRGDPDLLRADVSTVKREQRKLDGQAKQLAEQARRRDTAISLARSAGAVSGRTLGEALGLAARTVDPILADLAARGVLARDAARGYILAPDRGAQ